MPEARAPTPRSPLPLPEVKRNPAFSRSSDSQQIVVECFLADSVLSQCARKLGDALRLQRRVHRFTKKSELRQSSHGLALIVRRG